MLWCIVLTPEYPTRLVIGWSFDLKYIAVGGRRTQKINIKNDHKKLTVETRLGVMGMNFMFSPVSVDLRVNVHFLNYLI